jgi:hypothetical protein
LPFVTTTTLAKATIAQLQAAQNQLSTSEQRASGVASEVQEARNALADAKLAVLDPKSALVVAAQQLTAELTMLRSSGSSDARERQVSEQLEALKTAIAERVAVTPEVVEAARAQLSNVLSDPTSTAAEISAARIELAEARTPSLETVTEILADVSVADSEKTDPRLPIILPGVVDAPRQGAFVFLDDGQSKSMQVIRINNTALRLTSSEGFNLTISPRDGSGRPIELGTNGAVIVRHGNLVSIAGEGFAGNTLAKTWIFSSPRELGSLTVLDDGSFSEDYRVFDDIKPGLHTAQVNGTAPDGSTRSLSITIEVLPNEGPAPYDPLAKRSDVVQLIAELMALMVVMRSRDDEEEQESQSEDDRGSGDVNEIGAGGGAKIGGRQHDVFSPVSVVALDRWMSQLMVASLRWSRLLARVVRDGVYSRSLLGVFGFLPIVVGAALGLVAAGESGNIALIPVFGLLLAVLLLGVMDAFAGLAALVVYTVAHLAGGNIDSADAVRGLLGLAVLWFGVPIVAAAVRPFRRESYGKEPTWTRLSDMVVLPFVGAWGAGSMFGALPGLFGMTYESADRTLTVQLTVFGALVARYVFEQFAARLTAERLANLDIDTLGALSTQREIVASLVQTAIFVFVAIVFIGNNWALWLGAVLFVAPKLVATVASKFPKSPTLDRWLPTGITRAVIMLVVATAWARLLDTSIDDAATMLKVGFVLLGAPGLALTVLGWFAGGAARPRSTTLTKVGGVALVAFGVLVVFGFVTL